ncbi:hypothetical protein GCM10010345_82210 [Streptomyces canarius]|uniref:Uncharacterized protein n=1 Tax=Streptomyces canarius TaxID=285453 RepID=A0ABQ3D9Y7_9ACTN|nr:hypothetical protein GCM10010345_82210 [Streptomyces canarius]
MDGTALLDRKRAATCSHLSQLKGERPLPAPLSRTHDRRRWRILATGYHTRLGSPATARPPHVSRSVRPGPR